jgi:26S proteasome regulatory subunit (ATPase 3-interacting protein)
VSENVEGKQNDLFEEMGVDTDETVGVDYKSLEQLLPKKRRI